MAQPQFTLAVVGHNEAATLPRALADALAAAQPGDAVWFVDSGCDDDSAAIAAAAGAEVVSAPAGKGRAVQVALERCASEYLVLVDADIEESEHNIPSRLRTAVAAAPVELLIGEYDEPARRRVVTPSLFRPLVAALFPDVAALRLRNPLSGFRAVRVGRPLGTIPPGYGVEAHVDVEVAVTGGRIGRCDLGRYRGPLRGYRNIPTIAADVVGALLDGAVAHERMAASARPAWDAWTADILALVADQPPVGADDGPFLTELARRVARPMPPTN